MWQLLIGVTYSNLFVLIVLLNGFQRSGGVGIILGRTRLDLERLDESELNLLS